MDAKQFQEVRMAYTVLVVDDSETIRSVIERSFVMAKLPVEKVVHAVNGKDALEKLRETWVDIVFSDIHMPEMDGTALVAAMQQDPELKQVPVVIISTEGSATRIEELRKQGIRGYLRKPFTPEKIWDVIIEILGAWDG
jgi:two-component system chemotaxis response regulator CheY